MACVCCSWVERVGRERYGGAKAGAPALGVDASRCARLQVAQFLQDIAERYLFTCCDILQVHSSFRPSFGERCKRSPAGLHFVRVMLQCSLVFGRLMRHLEQVEVALLHPQSQIDFRISSSTFAEARLSQFCPTSTDR